MRKHITIPVVPKRLKFRHNSEIYNSNGHLKCHFNWLIFDVKVQRFNYCRSLFENVFIIPVKSNLPAREKGGSLNVQNVLISV